ncbi:hypothetical protein H4696_005320 [Amycolatopsis lexingtonensis]|uniref:Uncharacterized protein n=1 Tax=Amycolatopsis lexingtonensis TaxID=218822 RepID=A0ABR9I4Y9_9PSEU|nr:hypothetical protein [Amycolatopsis lexingtonensis]MBE1498220.1 hypothetical protein [Amycolatopsis lexingtonensis]
MLTREGVRTRWWRAALVVAAIAVVPFARNDPLAAVFGLLPVFLWAFSPRSPWTGVALVALLAWFVVPRELDATGPWVPAAIETYWLYPLLAAVAWAALERRHFGRLAVLVLTGFAVTGGVLFSGWEGPPGDEGVSPGPPGLRIAEDIGCGSGGCWRVLTATGDRAAEVVTGYLTAKNFAPAPQSEITRVPRFCRTTGLLVNHRTCAEVRPLGPASARVEWYVE